MSSLRKSTSSIFLTFQVVLLNFTIKPKRKSLIPTQMDVAQNKHIQEIN